MPWLMGSHFVQEMKLVAGEHLNLGNKMMNRLRRMMMEMMRHGRRGLDSPANPLPAGSSRIELGCAGGLDRDGHGVMKNRFDHGLLAVHVLLLMVVGHGRLLRLVDSNVNIVH